MKRAVLSMLIALGMVSVSAVPVAAKTRAGEAYVGGYHAVNQTGAVKLSWGFRDGTCHIRYTESNESVYKYETSASCNDGQAIISGLVPGQSYRFQVNHDWKHWSKPVVTKAKNWATGSVSAKTSHEVVNGNGAVKLSWGYRGGTCWIKYTEANQKAYKYSTVAGCDDGSAWIKALVPGRKYRFTVSNDGMNWSRPVTSVAKWY